VRVEQALTRFNEGDDAGFVACFDPGATVWTHTHRARSIEVCGHRQIAIWCREARRHWPEIRLAPGELSAVGAGAYLELEVFVFRRGGGGTWRLPLAIRTLDGLVHEIVPQLDRAAAIDFLSAVPAAAL
jgi:hypothetical protein